MQQLREGKDIAILSIGHIGNYASKAIKKLNENDIFPSHYDMRFVKPLDENFLALPPSLEFFSSTYTLCPLLARYVADDNPENPLPITQIFFLVFI